MLAALCFTVVLLVTTAYFVMGSVPLLVLKHDTALDSRFVRSFFSTYYLAAMLTAAATAVSYAIAGRPAFATGAVGLAILAAALRHGPGQSDLPYSRVMFDDLSRDFVVVGWDQRGTGKSSAALDPVSALTLNQAVADTLELSQYLRNRFDEKKIYLMGESWGSTLGVLAVQRQPELYYAWIGSGQMVSQRETDRRLYQDVLALADLNGDVETVKTMRAFGEPPYADIPYANAFVMGQYDRLYKPYTPPQAYMTKGNAAKLGPYGVLASEYNFVEKFNVLRGLLDMFSIMYPQLQEIDFRRDVPRLEVPVYILDGQAELTARRNLALEWFDKLEAPSKRMFSFENAAHSVAFEQFEAFHKLMLDTVLPETYVPVR